MFYVFKELVLVEPDCSIKSKLLTWGVIYLLWYWSIAKCRMLHKDTATGQWPITPDKHFI